MKLYSTKVRLSGNILNEVWKENVTAAELHLLAEIHKGGDNFPLAEVIETGSVQRSDRRERSRLLQSYLEWNLGKGAELITRVLGTDGVALPQAYAPPAAPDLDDEWDDRTMERPEGEPEQIETLAKPLAVIKPVRTRVPRGGLDRLNVVQHEAEGVGAE